MSFNKIVRGICYFTNQPNENTKVKLNDIANKLAASQYNIQTKRICTSFNNFLELEKTIDDPTIYLSIGSLDLSQACLSLTDFYKCQNTAFNIDLTNEQIDAETIGILFQIIKNNPDKTFLFTYVFNNKPSTPFFPSATYEKNGFSIGLQPTDLSEGCKSVTPWLMKIQTVWTEINNLFSDDPDFLGIDSSIAPMFGENSSFISFVKRLGFEFSQSTTTDIYLQIANFIKNNNPKPIGLCGLMFPCLEDDDLAKEYEQGNFSIERNIYLSLHSGLGIDTYPIGIDEKPKRIVEILKLIQGLSNKYKKPLSCRFVSDGKAKIGEKTNFQNQYLKDVVIRPL